MSMTTDNYLDHLEREENTTMERKEGNKIFSLLIGLLVVISLFYMTWHFGRWYEGEQVRVESTQSYTNLSNRVDEYTKFMLKNCLQELEVQESR